MEVGAEWRNTPGVAGMPLGSEEATWDWPGRTARPISAKIAGAGRAGWRRQLCECHPAGTIKASATNRTSAGLRDIEVSISKGHSLPTIRVGRGFLAPGSSAVQVVGIFLPSVLLRSRRLRGNQT